MTDAYQRSYSFAGFQATNPQRAAPGPKLDEEFDNVGQLVNALRDALAKLQRSDGKLKNGLVTRESLASDLTIDFTLKGPWEIGESYSIADAVFDGVTLYRARVANTADNDNRPSSDPATWEALADFALVAPDKTKLDGVEAGAQVNRARATQSQALAGQDNAADMSALRTADAVDLVLNVVRSPAVLANATPAIQAAQTKAGRPCLSGGTYQITTDLNFPKGKRPTFQGAKLYIASGVTVFLDEPPDVGDEQIFDGPGEVRCRYLRPQWFGAKGDYDDGSNTGTDDTAALNKMLVCASKSYYTRARPIIDLGRAKFLVSDTVWFRVGQGFEPIVLTSGPDHGGTMFWASSTFAADKPVVLFAPHADAGAASASIVVQSFGVAKAPGSAANIGVQVGKKSQAYWSPYVRNRFEGIVVSEIKTGFRYENARLNHFYNLRHYCQTVADGVGFHLNGDITGLSGTVGGGYIGETLFSLCEMIGPNTTPRTYRAYHIETVGGTSSDIAIAAISWSSCNHYATKYGLHFNAKGGSIRDLWVRDGQGDRSSCWIKIEITSSGAATVGNFSASGIYQTASAGRTVDTRDCPAGSIDAIRIRDIWSRGGGTEDGGVPAIDAEGWRDFDLQGNTLIDASAGSCGIRLVGCTDGRVALNEQGLVSGSQTTDFIRIESTSVRITTVGNRAGTSVTAKCVNDIGDSDFNVHIGNDGELQKQDRKSINLYYDGFNWRFRGNGYGYYERFNLNTGVFDRYKSSIANTAGAGATAILVGY